MKMVINMKEKNMKVNLKMINQMEKASCIGKMEIDMKEIGKMI